MTKRILFICPFAEGSGAEEYVFPLVENLPKEKYESLIVIPSTGRLTKRFASLGIKISFVPLNKLKARNPIPFIETVIRLYWLIKREKIDIVFCLSVLCNQYGAFAAKMAHIPTVCVVQNLRAKRALSRTFVRLADRVVVISKAIESIVLDYGISRDRVRLIYHCVDLSKYIPSHKARANFRGEFGISDDDFVIGIVGRIVQWKGHHVLINALYQVLLQHERTYLLIVGDIESSDPDILEKDYLTELQQLISELGLTARVIFTGYRDDVWRAFNAIDVLVLPSDAEPFGRVLIEAMVLEKPVIATNAGGAPDAVLDGVTGFLVPVGQHLTLSNRIVRLMQDEELMNTFGRNGQKQVKTHFSLGRFLEAHEKGFEELLGS